MSEKKRGINPWVFTVILGVLAILFSVFAIQEQATAVTAQKEADKLKDQLIECESNAAAQLKISQEQAAISQKQLEQANAIIEANSKAKKK